MVVDPAMTLSSPRADRWLRKRRGRMSGPPARWWNQPGIRGGGSRLRGRGSGGAGREQRQDRIRVLPAEDQAGSIGEERAQQRESGHLSLDDGRLLASVV